MTTKRAKLQPILPLAGVQPVTDGTAGSTKHWVMADKIRFIEGLPQKIGGWRSVAFEYGELIVGYARSIYSATIAGVVETVIGTHSRLFSLAGQALTNITPLETATTAAANSITTKYITLAADPITTVAGSRDLQLASTSTAYERAGDSITISGATTTNGVPDTEINAAHIIRSVGTGSITIRVATAATSSGTGGGASVVKTSGRIQVVVANTLTAGERVKISGAAATGGIDAADINVEHIVRWCNSSSFHVLTDGVASSKVDLGGGASTVFQKQIANGYQDESQGQGYGMGRYGVGLYGVSKSSSSARRYPRTWFIDRFADAFIMTPGNQTGVYTWDGDESVAPSLLSGAPTAVNYAFVSNSIVVTFGAGGVENKIFASDIGTPSEWTASSTNQVFEDNIEGAGRLTSHASVVGTNLIFTEHQVYTFRYIGLPSVWEIKLLDGSVGLIAPMARCVAKGVAYWQGLGNYYKSDGASVSIIPSNSDIQSTILDYVFNDINVGQKSKIFCWYNSLYNEVWWHYPSASVLEPDRVARLSLADNSWVMDTIERTAAEYPNMSLNNPRLANATLFYVHEHGNDADGAAMPWSLTSPDRTNAPYTTSIMGIIPDSTQTGDINVSIAAKPFPQSSASITKSYTVSPTTQRVATMINGRAWNYTFSGSEAGQFWKMGNWQEYVQTGGRN